MNPLTQSSLGWVSGLFWVAFQQPVSGQIGRPDCPPDDNPRVPRV